jgi:hypothetical protein
VVANVAPTTNITRAVAQRRRLGCGAMLELLRPA